MKKIVAFLITTVLLSCLIISSVLADVGYVLTKGVEMKAWDTYDYCGVPYGKYKELIDEVTEEEGYDDYCILYFSIADSKDEAFIILAGENMQNEIEMTLWNDKIDFTYSLAGYVKSLEAYDSFSDLQDDGTKFILVGDFHEEGRVTVSNSLIATICSQAMTEALDEILK